VIVVGTTELEQVTALIMRRGTEMVPDAMQEGKQHADSYAQAGGRHAHDPRRRYPATRRRTMRVRRATAAQQARMCEHVMYRRLHDFWGAW